jgi:hypothetical protein
MIKPLIIAAVTFFLAPLAHANGIPRYEQGQAFIFDNGRVERVDGVDGDRITWAARSGRTYVRDANPIVPILEWSYRGQDGTRRIMGDPDRLWPLSAGRSVQFRAVNETRDRNDRMRRSVHLWQCSVRAAQDIHVPAGRFEAFPIVCDRYSASSMRVIERLTWHYAPDVGHYVRREARNMSDGVRETYALYAALPPRASNPIRLEALARQARGASRTASGQD